MSNHRHSANCGCADESKECVELESLLQSIDMDKLSCLNEEEDGMCKNIFKAHSDRFDGKELRSPDDDGVLILTIHFSHAVNIRAFSLICGGQTCPRAIRAFVNRTDVDFDSVEELRAKQEWKINEDAKAALLYKMRAFSNVSSLTLHIVGEDEEEAVGLQYLVLLGKTTKMKKQALLNMVYESKPQPGKSLIKEKNGNSNVI